MRHKILLIEDESSIADNVIFALQGEGYDVSWFQEGQKGLACLAEGQFDFLILDVGLPDLNGFEVLKKLRTFSKVPVIMLTARSDEIDKVLGLEMGADDYMGKPFSTRELAARIKAVLRRNSPGAGPGLSQFIIDSNRHCIFFRKKNLQLSRYEYKILELLLRRPGWVFSREQIMQQVWEEPEESFERTVDAHIKTIRAKIKDVDESVQAIITHRGLGYSVAEDL